MLKFYFKSIRNKLLNSNLIINEIHQKIEFEKNSLISDMNHLIENNAGIVTKEIENYIKSFSEDILNNIFLQAGVFADNNFCSVIDINFGRDSFKAGRHVIQK